MAISLGVIALAAVILLIAAAIYAYVRKKIEETNRKLASAMQEITELKKNFDDFEKLLLTLDSKTKGLSKDVGKIHLARFEECG